MQQVFDVPKRKWKANVHHDRQANDLRAALKVLEGGAFAHAETLGDHPARLNRIPSDKTAIGASAANSPFVRSAVVPAFEMLRSVRTAAFLAAAQRVFLVN